MFNRISRPRPLYAIDPVAFLIALPGTLALYAAPTLTMMLLGALGIDGDLILLMILAVLGGGAVLLGGPVFLTVGGLSLFLLLRRGTSDPGDLAGSAFVINLAVIGVGLALVGLAGGSHALSAAFVLAALSALFAPLWGLTFGWLYNRLRRDFYAIPVT